MAHLIEVKGIGFHYPQSPREILQDCSLTIDKGELVSVLGPNGAGKSTLLNCCCGLLFPQKGEVLINGRSVRTMDPREIAKNISYVQQTQKSSFPHTVYDYVLMGRASNVGLFQKPGPEDRRIAEEALEKMHLSRLAEKAITEISGGERQQAAIARAVAQQPQAILFDEPTAHLDYGNQIRTLRLISSLRDQGFAVLMTTHNPDHCMMLGGRVAILNRDGCLETGTVRDVLTEEKLCAVYNSEIHLEYVESVGRTACIPGGFTYKR